MGAAAIGPRAVDRRHRILRAVAPADQPVQRAARLVVSTAAGAGECRPKLLGAVNREYTELYQQKCREETLRHDALRVWADIALHSGLPPIRRRDPWLLILQ